jgi:cytochrome c oxidase cbb3-type subunit 3
VTSDAAVTPEQEEQDEQGPPDGKLLDHSYDGIQEYDNPLPGWWSAIFIGSIVFAVAYGAYYHVTSWGSSPAKVYEQDLAEWNEKKAIRDRTEASRIDEATLASNAKDANLVARGAEVFATKCVTCHAAGGVGQIGPNLTDAYQLHGTTRMDILHTIHDGVSGTAMIAWGDQLPPDDLISVTTYVTTLRNTDKPGKAPEGAQVGPFAP